MVSVHLQLTKVQEAFWARNLCSRIIKQCSCPTLSWKTESPVLARPSGTCPLLPIYLKKNTFRAHCRHSEHSKD